MKTATICLSDIWNESLRPSYIVIPTNKSINKNGLAIMGRGIARQASTLFPIFPKLYGDALKANKTNDGFYIFPKFNFITIAVKEKYSDNATIDRIRNQMILLNKLGPNLDKNILVPMLGCGFGDLTYEEVMPILIEYSFDNMIIIIPSNKLYSKEKYRESFLPGVSGKKDRRVGLSKCFSDIEI